MARCRRKRKMCKSRCRTRKGRFKRCRSGDRRYPLKRRYRRRSRRRARSRRRRNTWRCRSRSGSFKQCRYCDKRYRVRHRSRSESTDEVTEYE